jgi:hypothetical protein
MRGRASRRYKPAIRASGWAGDRSVDTEVEVIEIAGIAELPAPWPDRGRRPRRSRSLIDTDVDKGRNSTGAEGYY